MSIPTATHDDASSPTSPSYLLTTTQRKRLVKSTRKLAKILGTTPLLQVTPPSPGYASTTFRKAQAAKTESVRSGSRAAETPSAVAALAKISSLEPALAPRRRKGDASDSDASSIRSASSAPAMRGSALWPDSASRVRLMQPPILRFKAKRPDQETSRFSISSRTSTIGGRSRSGSTASVFSTLITPITSRFSTVSNVSTASGVESEKRIKEREIKTRRKRISKLKRFLGEAVPPTLVTPTLDPARKQQLRRSRSLSISDLPLQEPPLPEEDYTRSERPSFSSSRFAPLETSSGVVVAEGDESQSYVCPSPTPTLPRPSSSSTEDIIAKPAADIGAFPSRRSHLRARSEAPPPRFASMFDATGEGATAYFDDAEPLDDTEPRSSSMDLPPRSESRLQNLLDWTPEQRAAASAHRSERRQGWSGEWNAASVQDVIVKLRDLR
ncbi:hypothetical protein BV25DRAFT_1545999 [Artomyces pyxidatus]|uniref:Uncharacterized protein n=1 Tax=Artomyces pyxidatus TaxID=48021 RepID=A0ACB8SKT9_9AGAM|nr:hypothetical protein BV25DRAFT_1545999 [Artomyces pyxidatus]